MTKKSLLITYMLWLFFGLFGLHHFYLNRDRHAFVMWMTVGGYFGCGWIRDIWRIPTYVSDANDDPEYLAQLSVKMRKKAKPDSGFVRHIATIIVADVLGYLAIGAIPTELFAQTDNHPNPIYVSLCAILAPLAVAIGVHTIGNIGRQKGSIKWALIGAYLTFPLYTFSNNIIFWTSLSSNYFFNKYAKEWRRIPLRKKSVIKRIVVLTLCGLVYSSLWMSWLYFNCSITDKNDQEIKCREAAQNFFKSPVWQECRKVFDDLKLYITVHGWSGLWREIVDAFDPQGEVNALKTLGLPAKSSQENITMTYRKLSRQWHPDKHRDPQAKKIAEQKFIEIQRAYEVLSRIKSQRMKAQLKPEKEEEVVDKPNAE